MGRGQLVPSVESKPTTGMLTEEKSTNLLTFTMMCAGVSQETKVNTQSMFSFYRKKGWWRPLEKSQWCLRMMRGPLLEEVEMY